MRFKTRFLLLLSFLPLFSIGQRQFLCLGNNNNGLCFGNSSKFNGIRLNAFDKPDSITLINGINLTLTQAGTRMNGVSLGLLISDVSVSNGLLLSGFFCGGTHNGISINSGWSHQLKNNGISFSLISSGETYNGIATALWTVYAKQMNGLALAGFYVHSTNMNGLSMSFLHTEFKKQSGVSVSLYNKAEVLHGIQFGLINYAGNNKKIFRWMPLFNFNFRTNKSSLNNGKP